MVHSVPALVPEKFEGYIQHFNGVASMNLEGTHLWIITACHQSFLETAHKYPRSTSPWSCIEMYIAATSAQIEMTVFGTVSKAQMQGEP